MRLQAESAEWRTAHEFVRETLRRAILRGELSGGARLIPAELAAELQVSTTPIREALRDLATEGLITLDRHRGGVVRELNWDDMKELCLIREQLDPLAVGLAVEGVTDQGLREADELCDRMENESDLANWVELNRRFHLLFYEATGSTRLVSILKGLEEASALYVAQAQRWRPEIRRRAGADHRALVDACRRRDREAALQAMAGHARIALESTELHGGVSV